MTPKLRHGPTLLLSTILSMTVTVSLSTVALANTARTHAETAEDHRAQPAAPNGVRSPWFTLKLSPVPLRLADITAADPPPQAVQPAPQPLQPVGGQSPRRVEVVHHHEDSYMSTIAGNAFMGGLAGALIGGAIYYLHDNQTNPRRIIYWAAGGVLVGAGVGVIQVVVQESRTENISAQSHLPVDPAPTFRLALLTRHF